VFAVDVPRTPGELHICDLEEAVGGAPIGHGG
jgi:hypothetical protein